MGNIGDPISTAIPSVNASGTAYASDYNTIMTEVLVRLTKKVPVSALLNTDSADFDLNNGGVQNAEYLGLYEQASAPSGTPHGRWARYNGNVYWVDAYGAVQITSGANLNAAGLGGIVGDYGGADPAKVSFVGGTETYEFYDNQAGSEWALIKARGLELIDEGGLTLSMRPHATTAAWTMTMPENDPAAGVSLVALNNSGQLSLAESQDITNQFKVTGGGVKHDDVTQWWPPNTFHNVPSAGGYNTTSGKFTHTDPCNVVFFLPAPPVGRRLKGVSARVLQSAGSTCTVAIFDVDDGDATPDAVGTNGTSTTVGSAITVTATATDTAPAARIYRVVVTFSGGGAGLTYEIYSLGLIYDYV